jgi:rubrerythrin
MGTRDNLEKAFTGECKAGRMYLSFAQKASEDGFPQVAKLFRAASEAESVHALALFRVMGGIKDTAQNLETALEGERKEFEDMYPEFLAIAQNEAKKPAAFTFRNTLIVEEIHHSLYTKARDAVKAGHDLNEAPIYVCTVCGNTVEDTIPTNCPVCNVSGIKFMEIF